MSKSVEILTVPVLDLDFFYYLIYLFFKDIADFILNPFSKDTPTDINFINVYKYATNGKAVVSPEEYERFGNGIASFYDGYSLFRPPHGLDSFGGLSGWIENFFVNPYCADCPSFFDLFFGGMNFFIWMLFLLILSIFIYLKFREISLKKMEAVVYDTVYQKDFVESSNKKAQRWQKILDLTNSENENDWRAAIIDADNFLEEVLEENGYPGATLGEKLKTANFSTVQNAWEAHKLRNEIAHNSSLVLTHRDVKRAIANFGQVFSEFYHL